jgi:hypothetical protein
MAKKEEDENNQSQQLNIELPEGVAEGTYSNLAIITHSNTEFVLDFIRIMPGVPQARVKARILLTPSHAKRLLKALSDNISKYEAVHGKIDEGQSMEGFPIHFGGPTAEA